MWVEFYEDHYTENPDAAVDVKTHDDVQFVTGDDEFDELERRMAQGDITEEEIQQTLANWESGDAGEQVVDHLEGFDDNYRG